MRILWVKTDFLHPTNRGGQIRTLEMLRRIHSRHEVHFVARDEPASPEGRERAREYSSFVWPVNRPVPPRGSPRFFLQLASNLISPLPLAVGRYESAAMKQQIASVLASRPFDAIVCDFLSSAPNIPDLSRAVIFQHNVESNIWERHAQHAPDAVRRFYFNLQATRMLRCEADFCRRAAHVVSVSPNDTAEMRTRFGVTRISEIPTGVDIDYFARPADQPRRWDIVFVGAMDWLPNLDGARFFMAEVLPLIRAQRPATSVVFAGRNPGPEIQSFAQKDSLVTVTGTVPDVRPFVWSSAVSIVPLRIGGGTRLKIYEAMAAGTPVVSTSIGAEGLAVTSDRDILLRDGPREFADACLALLGSPQSSQAQAAAALHLVSSHFSWDSVAARFENILEQCRLSLS